MKDNNVMKDLIFFLGFCIVSMAGFWMMIGGKYVNREEAVLLIQQQTVAIETKLDIYHSALLEQEDRISKQEDKLQKVLEQNTEAINELKIQIATLSQSLKSINMSWSNEQAHPILKQKNLFKKVIFYYLGVAEFFRGSLNDMVLVYIAM